MTLTGKMLVVFLDLEGVLIPEIWDGLAEVTRIEELKLTTRDIACLLYTSPSPRDQRGSRMPSSA